YGCNSKILLSTRLDTILSDVDGKPYTTLLYGNGPGYTEPRTIPQGNPRDIIQSSAVPRLWSTHGGEDVPVFASGPLANILFSGTFDQSYIPHVIAYIACIGEYAKRCSTIGKTVTPNNSLQVSGPYSVPSSVLSQLLYYNRSKKKKKDISNQMFCSFPYIFTTVNFSLCR
ncbi:hypothetical protein L9F63_025695, partial [Diploptera punctata]